MRAFIHCLIQSTMCLIVATAGAAATEDGPTIDLQPTQPFHLSGQELEIWNSPSFKKRFAESYLSETEIEPRVTEKEREQMLKVLELISADEMDKAVALIEKNRGEAASAVFDFTLANIYFQQEKYNDAAEAYGVAVEKHPKFLRAWRNLSLIYVRAGEFDKALPALRKVIELGSGDALTYGLLGFAYSSVGKHLSAESAYRMANLLDPDTADWKLGMAQSFFKQERYADAVALTGQLIAEKPNSAQLWLLQANAYIGLGRPLDAAKNFEIVDELGQATSASLNTLGDIYVNEGLYDVAADRYIQAMDKGEKSKPDRAVRAAQVLTARGAYDEVEMLVKHIEQRFGQQLETKTHKDLLKLQARIAVAKGAGDEEARVLEQIVELDPLDGEALILLGQHSARAGDFEQAVFYYERAEGIEGFEADAKVRHGQLLVGQGKYGEALPLLRRAQQIKHRDNVQEYIDQVERVAKSR